MANKIKKCRICGNKNLLPIISLGKQCLTGVFPNSQNVKITSGELELVKCHPLWEKPASWGTAPGDERICHLVQLGHTYSNNEIYGDNYGYRSGLNKAMIEHLKGIVKYALSFVAPKKNDLIIDIGSNDSTLLRCYPKNKFELLGIDPTGIKFKKYYPNYINLISDFFSYDLINKKYKNKKAKIITSIAMIYDLDNPIEFVKDVYKILDDDGVWIFEQSYLPLMLIRNSYDTICHEHLEYYTLHQIKYMMDLVGFKIIDVKLNNSNGGSFRTCVTKKTSSCKTSSSVEKLLKKEKLFDCNEMSTYTNFIKNTYDHKIKLFDFIKKINNSGKKVFGYGASTKGNVILQWCGFSTKEIPYVVEVNEDKFGCYTPHTNIPIISEKKAKELKPDYYLVFPYHFKKNIIEKEKKFLRDGGKLIFPLPFYNPDNYKHLSRLQ